MKRFYSEAAVAPDQIGSGVAFGTFTVALDGRPIRTPAKRSLTLASQALAQAIAAEWQAQKDEVRPQTMPLTKLASTAIDRVRDRPGAVVDEIARYAETDLLCYRAEGPEELVARQHTTWQPLLDWAAERFQAHLQVTTGVVPMAQAPAAVAALRAAVAAHDAMVLAALQTATAATGSAVLGLAVAEGHIDGEAAWQASQIDETFQLEKWGEDGEAAERRAALRAEIVAAARFIDLYRG